MLTASLQKQLIQAAISAIDTAYAPYSNFQVGAAILAENGKLYTGCNVENAAYPVGSCAEAGAISAMVQSGQTSIKAIAVAGRGEELCTPCGGCRQRIREFADQDTPILVCNTHGLQQKTTLAELLPLSFGPDNLNNYRQPKETKT